MLMSVPWSVRFGGLSEALLLQSMASYEAGEVWIGTFSHAVFSGGSGEEPEIRVRSFSDYRVQGGATAPAYEHSARREAESACH
jgi:hypothetical protein